MKVRRSCLAALGVAALAIPAAAVAHQGHGKGHASGHPSGQGNHNVQYIFKGTYDGSGLVTVDHGNRHVRQAGLIGDVQFDLTNTKLSVADTNADTVIDVNDVLTDDKVVVQARLPKQDPGVQPFAPRHLVDQTNPSETETSETETD